MYCKKCGNEIPNNSKFCDKCGFEISADFTMTSKDIPFDFKSLLKNKKLMVTISVILSAVILLIILFTFNTSSVVNKKQICNDISEYENFIQYDLKISEYEEEKRDTSKEDKYDRIWANIIAKNDNIQYTSSYMITYKLYNNGWILENIEIINSNYMALEALDSAMIKDELLSEYKDLITDYELEDIDIKVSIPTNIDSIKTVDLRCVATAKNDRMTAEGIIDLTYTLMMSADYCGWKMTDCEMVNQSYSSLTEPTQELLSKTTKNWTNTFSLINTEKTNDNEYIYTYKEADNKSFKGIEVEWKTTLKYTFSPDTDWKLSETTKELTYANVTEGGTWTYSEEGESCTVKINSVNGNKVNFDIDITYIPVEFGSSYSPKSYSKKGVELTWSYTYYEHLNSISFITDKYIDVVNSRFSYYPKLEYSAYSDNNEETTGYKLTDSFYWDLKKVR